MASLRVQELAKKRGLNITTLSRAAELTYNQAWRIWHGKVTSLEFATLDRIAKALEVSVGELFANDVQSSEIRTPARVATLTS